VATTRNPLKSTLFRRQSLFYKYLIYMSFLYSVWPLQTVHAQQIAAQNNFLSEQDFLADIPLVLGASRLPQRAQDAPAATIIIDRQTIEATGMTNVADVMRLVPGMYVGYFKGHAPTVALHGLTGEYSGRMQVLVDGRSVYNSFIGSVEWNDIPLLLEDIERIEVVRGPNAAAFGANAFMGVINIITRDAATASTAAKLALGDNGQRRLMGRYSGHGGSWNYRLSAGYRADDGIDNLHDSQAQKIIDLRANYHPSSIDTFGLGLGYNMSKRDRGDVAALFEQPYTQPIDSAHAQLRWQRVLSVDNDFSTQLYHNSYALEGRTRTAQLPQVGVAEVGGTLAMQRTDLEAQYRFSPAVDWRAVAGAGVRRDSARSLFYLATDKRETNNNARVFAHGEWSATSRLVLNLGAMLEDTSYTGREFSPRVALNYRLSPDHALRASSSRAHRTPTIFEEKADNYFDLPVIGQPIKIRVPQGKATGGLQSEHIISNELGYVGNFSEQGITLDLRAYRDKLDHLVGTQVVVLPEVPGVRYLNGNTLGLTGFAFSAINRSQAIIKGYEAHMRLRPNAKSDVLLSYANTRINSFDNGPNPPAPIAALTAEDRTALERSMPRNTFSLLATRQLPDRMQGSVGYYQTSKVEPLSAGNLIPVARRMDVRLAYRLEKGGSYFREGEAALVLQNLLGKYADFERNNIMQQRAYFSFETHW
jgi:iron complex outermembrane recepter protein